MLETLRFFTINKPSFPYVAHTSATCQKLFSRKETKRTHLGLRITFFAKLIFIHYLVIKCFSPLQNKNVWFPLHLTKSNTFTKSSLIPTKMHYEVSPLINIYRFLLTFQIIFQVEIFLLHHIETIYEFQPSLQHSKNPLFYLQQISILVNGIVQI